MRAREERGLRLRLRHGQREKREAGFLPLLPQQPRSIAASLARPGCSSPTRPEPAERVCYVKRLASSASARPERAAGEAEEQPGLARQAAIDGGLLKGKKAGLSFLALAVTKAKKASLLSRAYDGGFSRAPPERPHQVQRPPRGERIFLSVFSSPKIRREEKRATAAFFQMTAG